MQSVVRLLYLVLVMFWSAALNAAAPDVLAAFKATSGGARWDAVRTMQLAGRLEAGGLEGEYRASYDLLTGRYVNEYSLGPVNGAEGYDGAAGWTKDPGGEVAVLDAPEARRRARTQAWLDARGYWYPERIAAAYAAPERREEDGKHYVVVTANPQGGDPVDLWFDARSNLLARVVQRIGADLVSTHLDDYREQSGVRLPFLYAVHMTDAAGRTDPRRSTRLSVQQVSLNVRLAEQRFEPPSMTASARIEAPSGVTRVPFELINNHIYVDARIDGQPATLLVDTGGVNLLSPAAVKRLGLQSEGKLAASGVGDERVDLGFANAKRIQVGEAVLDNPVFYVLDLGDIERVEGRGFDGLVGYELFRRFGVEIDYARRVLTLTEPKRFAPPAGAAIVPFELSERIPIVTGVLDGRELRLSVDTGSRVSLTLHSPFVREHDLTARYAAAPEAVVGWGVGGASRGRPARFGVLQLGELRIENVVGDLYMGDKGAFATPDIGGNLGGGVLRRFTVAFDYEAKRMYLAPNASFGEPDAFDRSGVWLLDAGEALEVADVAPQSAAARAGLEEGDRILAIAGAPVNGRSLNDWRGELRERPAGDEIAIRFERNGERKETTLTLADRVPPPGGRRSL